MSAPSSAASAPNAEPDPAALEAGRVLFTRPVTFVRGVVNLDQLPDDGRPETAFAGRSNVGKSSLINALFNRKGLARASNEPGRTREINFFDLDGAAYVVDLPGYGYARAPKPVVERWTALTRNYLRGRATLTRVFLLVDSRRGLTKADLDMMDLFDAAATSYQLTATKTDKLKPAELAAVLDEIAARVARRPAAHPVVLATSSTKRAGLEMIRAEIAALTTRFGVRAPGMADAPGPSSPRSLQRSSGSLGPQNGEQP